MMNFHTVNGKFLGDNVVWIRYRKDAYLLLFGGMDSGKAVKYIEEKLPKDTIPEDMVVYSADKNMSAESVYGILTSMEEDK